MVLCMCFLEKWSCENKIGGGEDGTENKRLILYVIG